MKAIRKILILLSFVVMFASCANQKIDYYNMSEQSISLNYNNISSMACGWWVDSDCILDVQHNFFFDVYMTTEKGRTKIGTTSHGIRPQKYGDVAYWLEVEYPSSMRLIGYNTVTKESQRMVTVDGEDVHGYLILDEILYAITAPAVELEYDRTLQAVSMKTNESVVIAKNVISIGVVDGSLRYVMVSEMVYEIYQYDFETQTSVAVGSFRLDEEEFPSAPGLLDVNFTSKYLLFTTDMQTPMIYDIERNTVDRLEAMSELDSMIAFESCAFMLQQKESETTLFHFTIESRELKEIATFDTLDVGLFVTSDHDAYVTCDESIVQYTSEGKATVVVTYFIKER